MLQPRIVSMATAQTVLQVCGGNIRCFLSSKPRLSRSWSGSHSRSFVKYKRRKAAACFEPINFLKKPYNDSSCQFPRSVTSNRLSLSRCNCERAESLRGLTSEDGFVTSNGGVHSNGAILCEGNTDSIEDEAWDLLRESIVYYCNSPVGTIAAKDPSESTNVLNYDHVFIRDFIPSGIAFLLKGEYDIVRNFLLHTLQLQVSIHPNFNVV